MAFDTLKLARALREQAKLPAEQAEGFANAIAEAVHGDLATKGDIREVRADVQLVRADVQLVRAELRETELKLAAETQRLAERLTAETLRLSEGLTAETRRLEQKLSSEVQQVEGRLKVAIESGKSEILKWTIGLIGLQTVAILGALLALVRLVRP